MSRLILTASGGPFLHRDHDQFDDITVERISLRELYYAAIGLGDTDRAWLWKQLHPMLAIPGISPKGDYAGISTTVRKRCIDKMQRLRAIRLRRS